MSLWTSWPSIAALCLSLLTASGGLVFVRRLQVQSVSNIQDRIIAALREENRLMDEKINRLQRDITVLKETMVTVQTVLKRKGILLQISEDTVTIVESGRSRETSVKVSQTTKPAPSKSRSRSRKPPEDDPDGEGWGG